MKALGALLFGLLLVAIGAVGGFYLRTELAGMAAASEQEEEEPVDEEFEETTLANLGVEIGPLQGGTHVVTRTLHGVVADPGLWRRPASAPFAGTVSEVLVRPGALVKAGQGLVRVLRDDLPVVQFSFAQGLLAPMDEDLHSLYVQLRAATTELELTRSESQRIEELAGDGSAPLVSAQQRIGARQALRRAESTVANHRAELHVHGFEEGQIDDIAAGGHPLRDQAVRMEALRHHGMWDEGVASVFESLPEPQQKQGWTIAALGEVQSQGLWTADLRSLLMDSEGVRGQFRSAMSLILAGSSVARVRTLAAQGALDPLMEIRAPADAPDWDVVDVVARPGARLAAGDVVVRLDRPAEMWLRLEPVGDEVAMVRRAMQEGVALGATPLVEGSGPVLDGLRIERLTVEGGRTVAIVAVPNQPVELAAAGAPRSWSVQAGVRYAVRLPTETMENVFIVPREAITDRGPDRILFEAHGLHFHEYPVRVLYEDADVAVLPIVEKGFEVGDDVVLRGAFALAQALQLEGGGGHSHPHPH